MEFLKEILDRQEKFGERIGYPLKELSDADAEKLTKEYILAMHAELTELLDWINWKIWKNTKVGYDSIRIREIKFELIDILHFWANLCLIWGLGPEQIVSMYREKNEINHKRQDANY